jgi:hypothetical protein
MQNPRFCDLYNGPGEDCEYPTVCGTPQNNCLQHSTSKTRVGEWSTPVRLSSTDGLESATKIQEKYDKYNKFIDISFGLSTSAVTNALGEYCATQREKSFAYEDQKLFHKFRKIVELAKRKAEEVDVCEFAESMTGNCFTGMRTSAVLIAVRRYRMIVQLYEVRVRVDEDILRNLLILFARVRQEGREAVSIGAISWSLRLNTTIKV